MASVTVRLDTSDWQRGIDRLGARAPVAIVRALNRSARSVSTVMGRLMSGDTGLRVGVVREQLRVTDADVTHLTSSVSVRGKRIPLIDFGARGPEPSRGRGRGVSARMQGGRNRYPHAFIATMRSGHRGVFARVGSMARKSAGAWSKNLPIVELRGPSLPLVFAKFTAEGAARGEEQLVKNLAHEFRFALGQRT